MKALLLTLLLASSCAAQLSKLHTPEEDAQFLGALTDPRKLATLKGKRAATPRLRKVMYWLRMAQRDGNDPAAIIEAGQKAARSHGTQRAKLLRESLLRNLDILRKLGCLEVAGIGKLRTGNAPTITLGPYKGELATVDPIIPRSVCPELDNVLINLEFLPDRLNRAKADKVGNRQAQLARKWHKAGVLSAEGLKGVEARHKGFIGLTKAQAIARAKTQGLKWRVVEEDGESFLPTLDYRKDRVNFTIKDGKVVKAENG